MAPGCHTLRPGEAGEASPDDAIAVDADEEERAEPVVRCAACKSEVTRPEHRIEVEGRHAHRFMNPMGQVFDVLCFAEASGAYARGEPSSSYSWFPPDEWQFAQCAQCHAQLGWFFTSGFYGLIPDALIVP